MAEQPRAGTRVASGAFTQLSQGQINQIKESFTMLDNDRDGVISANDLKIMLSSLGQNPSSQSVNDMLAQMPSPLQFPAYLTSMSAILSRFSRKEQLVSAFSAFDEDDNGQADVAELKESLIDNGFEEAEIERCFKPYIKKHMGKERLLYKDLADAMIV
ncbi:hypothetical protein V1512DRAFT_200164 [Lipomyces arxii]|uniref:uncharacterized protein n=1 Tax=Lipomyces arxii TaxID=56418 RepID=UPI0034CDF973